ncbi:MAG TPA: hypothetical protein VMX18_03265 [Candidatus Bipolaricaulota bacterium]|nr:hypothetical protein [Candidatus Bipolaricaulota bacterium]
MSNKITEKYFSQANFADREEEVLAEVLAKTGFELEKEIFRGVIYQKNKVGSLIYKGEYQGKPAVLKLQGLKPEVDEAKILEKFSEQNGSQKVRLPELFAYEFFDEKKGYGYLITEYIDALKIFEMPFANDEEMNDFAEFYQEYRTSALTKPWLEPENLDVVKFSLDRAENWQKISESVGRLKKEDYEPYLEKYLEKYLEIVKKHFADFAMVFSHGHLTADDVYKMPSGQYVILSNLFWSYRPQWYDLAFNIWACLLHIRDVGYTFEEMIEYVNKWLDVYRQIPVVKLDPDFDKKIHLLLLERTMGSILVDLGAGDFYGEKENRKYFEYLLSLHQRLFDYLAEKFENHL